MALSGRPRVFTGVSDNVVRSIPGGRHGGYGHVVMSAVVASDASTHISTRVTITAVLGKPETICLLMACPSTLILQFSSSLRRERAFRAPNADLHTPD
jgi:hypothetical protein